MNNRLKFRVWEKSTSFMWQEDGPGLDDRYDRENFGSAPEVFLWALRDIRDDDYVVQQVTGLKTSLNQDIFEGDIMRFNLKYSDTPYIGEVAWSDESLSYVVYFSPDPTDQLVEDLAFVRSIEVLGNIFENPDLLK